METQEQSSLLKNAWNGDPSAVFRTKTLVSALFYLYVGETSDPSGSRKQFLGHSHSSSITVSWISLIARTTSHTQPLCLSDASFAFFHNPYCFPPYLFL